MQSEPSNKVHSILPKQKIFNVRKRAYKHFDNVKYLKYNCSPIIKKQPLQNIQNHQHPKKMEYHYQLAIMISPKYKELAQKYKQIKQKNRKEKQVKMNILKEKQSQLKRYVSQRQKLIEQRQRLQEKRHEIKEYITEMRQQRQIYHLQNIQQHQIYQNISVDQLKDTIMALHYQGGVDIDTDNMTYEQLLQLQQKMGKVSKGLTEKQYQQLSILDAQKKHEQHVCSICYENIKQQEKVHELRCKHMYHCQCIKQWFINEKTCPLCKQEVFDCQKS